MSEPRRVLLLGASGLVGQAVMRAAVGRTDMRLLAVARREVALPQGARMEVLVAPEEGWGEAVATAAPTHVICALGTTIRAAGGDREAFAAVDRDLVLRAAMHAKAAGARGFVTVSSVGADRTSKNFYLRTKGEMEAGLEKIGFARLDVLRPGLLRGRRSGDTRVLEALGRAIAPLANPLLGGRWRPYRAIRGSDVAIAALQATCEKAGGRFYHTHDEIMRMAGRWQRS